MKQVTTICQRSRIREDLFPLLDGRVFHATSNSSAQKILTSGHITGNCDGAHPVRDNSNGFFRNRNCVSLFDFRAADIERMRTAHDCFGFVTAYQPEDPAYFFLDEAFYPELWDSVDWAKCGEMIVPYVEVGFRDRIDMSQISEVLYVQLEGEYYL